MEVNKRNVERVVAKKEPLLLFMQNSYPNSTHTPKMGRSCQIYRQSKVDSNLISELPARIEQCFTNIGLKVSPEIHILDPPPKAYSKSRGQYKAGEVVDHCCRKAPGKICLYLLKDDAYNGDLNFVFGVAHRYLNHIFIYVSLHRALYLKR